MAIHKILTIDDAYNIAQKSKDEVKGFTGDNFQLLEKYWITVSPEEIHALIQNNNDPRVQQYARWSIRINDVVFYVRKEDRTI